MKYKKKELFNILKAVREDKIDSLYPELIPINDKLKLLLEPFKYHQIKEYHNMLEYHIENSLHLLLESPYKEYLDLDLLDVVTYNVDHPYIIETRIDALFNPKKVLENSTMRYLEAIESIIYIIYWNEDKDYHFKYEKLERLKQIIKEYSDQNRLYLIIDYNMVCTIFAYLLLNDIDDYSMIHEYMSDPKYYLEKLELFGLKPDSEEQIQSVVYQLIFAYIPNIFHNKEKIKR